MSPSQTPANENMNPEEVNDNAPDGAQAQAPGSEPTVEEKLQDEIMRLQEEITRLKDQWVRAIADTDNVRKRAQRDQEETSRYAVTGFAADMVSVLENIIRASESIPPEARKENELLRTLGEGVDLTRQELLNIFQKYKINRIDPQGQKFDHNLHQAVVQVERDDLPPGTVVQVVQAGYTIHDRLLRPAMVAVSKQGEAAKKVDTTA